MSNDVSSKRFLDYLMTLPDVYVVPIIDGLEWVRHPTTLDELDGFAPFQCDDLPKPSNCVSKACV